MHAAGALSATLPDQERRSIRRMHEPFQDAERELEQSVADPIAQNISEVLALESQELARTTRAQRGFEAVSRWLARPAYPIALLVFVVGWISLNLTARSVGLPHLDCASHAAKSETHQAPSTQHGTRSIEHRGLATANTVLDSGLQLLLGLVPPDQRRA